MKKVELLAPAGNMEKMKMAILYGADAVYLAGKGFGLRAYGGNFTNEELQEAVIFAHDRNRKVYVTVNIIPRNEDLNGLGEYLQFLESIHVDAALISDLGVFQLAREVAPQLPIHISTQASSANWRTVKAWKDMGAERVVMAREVSVRELSDIHKHVDVELEVFAHGAMCISWSGRCLLSNFFTKGRRQSNKGECIQACRFKYSVVEESRPGQYWPVEEDEHGTYIFNSKDLCMIAYRKAIDTYYENPADYQVHREWRAELEKVSHRPYTTAFAFQKTDYTAQEYDESQPTQSYDFVGLILGYNSDKKEAIVQQRNHFRVGEVVECLSPKGDVFTITIGKLHNKEGLEIEKAPHPLEELIMHSEVDLIPYTILRRPAHV